MRPQPVRTLPLRAAPRVGCTAPIVNGRPLRIVHVTLAPVGGIFRHILDLASGQARLGHEVGIITDSAGRAR